MIIPLGHLSVVLIQRQFAADKLVHSDTVQKKINLSLRLSRILPTSIHDDDDDGGLKSKMVFLPLMGGDAQGVSAPREAAEQKNQCACARTHARARIKSHSTDAGEPVH